jgi:hypothetical protein
VIWALLAVCAYRAPVASAQLLPAPARVAALRLVGGPAQARRRPPAGEQLGLSAAAFALSSVAFTIISLSAFPEWSRCSSS